MVNTRVWRSVLALEALVSVAEKLKPNAILFLGDMFSGTQNVKGYLATIVDNYLWRLSKAVRTICIAGNHDFFGGSYCLLGKGRVQHVWRRPAVTNIKLSGFSDVGVPKVLMFPFGVRRETKLKALDKAKDAEFCFMHDVVDHPNLPPAIRAWTPECLISHTHLQGMFSYAGHYHSTGATYGQTYIGPLIQQSFSDSGNLCGATYLFLNEHGFIESFYLRFFNIGVTFRTVFINTSSDLNAARLKLDRFYTRAIFKSPADMVGLGFGSDPRDQRILPDLPVQPKELYCVDGEDLKRNAVELKTALSKDAVLKNAMEEYARMHNHQIPTDQMKRRILELGLKEAGGVRSDRPVEEANDQELPKHPADDVEIPF